MFSPHDGFYGAFFSAVTLPTAQQFREMLMSQISDLSNLIASLTAVVAIGFLLRRI